MMSPEPEVPACLAARLGQVMTHSHFPEKEKGQQYSFWRHVYPVPLRKSSLCFRRQHSWEDYFYSYVNTQSQG
ncbi:rCG32094 [Rattus norvegicus]|uniref:RCG32094 n=1 Tax=Rattus norvegicus TaxID=10116 RepID=A6JWY4_RAT|nr:rCG32094 [Rattus norvegicus]